MNLRDKFFRYLQFWPPFLGAGIRIVSLDPNYRRIHVALKLKFWNANYVGTQFGGAMFSMTDPFYMVMMIKNLGPGIRVWDKAATIRYVKPGKTEVTATFTLSQEEIDDVHRRLKETNPITWEKTVQVIDRHGQVIAEVDKVLHIRKLEPRLTATPV